MTTSPVSLVRTDPVKKALKLFVEQRMLGIPIVDSEDQYLGMFVRSRLVSLMLPRVVSLDEQSHGDIGRLIDVGFIPDTLQDAIDRFNEVAEDPVERYMDKEGPILRPDSPVITALFLLYRTRNFLPVVDDKSKKLVGVVSTWDVLARVGA